MSLHFNTRRLRERVSYVSAVSQVEVKAIIINKQNILKVHADLRNDQWQMHDE